MVYLSTRREVPCQLYSVGGSLWQVKEYSRMRMIIYSYSYRFLPFLSLANIGYKWNIYFYRLPYISMYATPTPLNSSSVV